MANVAMWMIRSDGGALYDLFKDKSVVAMGWASVGNLSPFSSREALVEAIARQWPDWKEGRVRTSAGQLFRFAHEIQPGDRVITYNPQSRRYLLGKIAGPYQFVATPDDPSNPNIRAVQWQG